MGGGKEIVEHEICWLAPVGLDAPRLARGDDHVLRLMAGEESANRGGVGEGAFVFAGDEHRGVAMSCQRCHDRAADERVATGDEDACACLVAG